MTTLLADSAVAAAIWLIIKCSTLFGIAAIVQLWGGRRVSAATRHLVWMIVLAAVMVLPIATLTLPQWQVPIKAAVAAVETQIPSHSIEPIISDSTGTPTPGVAVERVEPSKPPTISAIEIVAVLYLTGVAALLMYWTAERWNLRRFARRAKLCADPEWTRLLDDCSHAIGVDRRVHLLRSVERNVPMTFGAIRPVIVLPAIAETWDANRRRAVLLHELAHVVRRDCLTQFVTLAACALYWFHPGAWWIARRVRIERELACDDRVIAAGTEPREYAGHLLEIAYSFGGRRAPALAVCMAGPRQLEGRMLAALDGATNRRMPSRRTIVLLATTALVVLVPLSALTLRLDAAPPVPAEWPAATESPTLSTTQSPSSQTKDWNDLKETVQNLKPLWDLKRFQGLAPAWHRPGITRAMRAVASTAGIAQENQPGTWEIRPTDKTGVVHLRIVELNSSSGTDVPVQQLEGLTGAQLSGAGGPVQFKVRRDAGTFSFEGVIRSGVGAGTFTFTPDPNFPAELAKRGFSRPTPSEQYQLARNDVGYTFLDELNKQGYAKPQTADLVRAGQHGVQTAYLREMGELGYKLGTLDPLITLRDHGVSPTYVRELADLGYKGLSADDLRQARDHGVTAEYVRAMRDAGYGSLPMRELINARDHGITTQYVRELDEQGYRKLPLDQLIRIRDHGVNPEYARGMRELGYALSVEDLVRARDHGVNVEYVREMAALGYGKQPIDSLIRVRDHGVTSDFAKDVKSLGYDSLSLDDLVTLRDHGWSAERIRSANAKAGTRLPVDMLKSLR